MTNGLSNIDYSSAKKFGNALLDAPTNAFSKTKKELNEMYSTFVDSFENFTLGPQMAFAGVGSGTFKNLDTSDEILTQVKITPEVNNTTKQKLDVDIQDEVKRASKQSYVDYMDESDATRYNAYWDNLENGTHIPHPGLSADDISKWKLADINVNQQIALSKIDYDVWLGRMSYTDLCKINNWDYRPSNSLYLRYKEVYDKPKYFNQKTGSINWPNNFGFLNGKFEMEVLQEGTVIDRYGSDFGTFVSPQGTTYTQRALPPGSEEKSYSVFEVVKPIFVKAGKIAPWFDEIGGGTQYLLPNRIDELLDLKIIRRIKL